MNAISVIVSLLASSVMGIVAEWLRKWMERRRRGTLRIQTSDRGEVLDISGASSDEVAEAVRKFISEGNKRDSATKNEDGGTEA